MQLCKLDSWYQSLKSAEPEGISAEDLVKIVEWKLIRGKWRPRLLSFAREHTGALILHANTKLQAVDAPVSTSFLSLEYGLWHLHAEDVVREASCQAFKLVRGIAAPNEASVEKAVSLLSELRGIGPATASAVLAVASPAVPFMSDEALAACVPGPKQYTLKAYMELYRALTAKAAELSEKESRPWHASHVEMALVSTRHS